VNVVVGEVGDFRLTIIVLIGDQERVDGSRDASEEGCSTSKKLERLVQLGRGSENVEDDADSMEHPIQDKSTSQGQFDIDSSEEGGSKYYCGYGG
jgi:hypothetical protein